MNILPKRVHVYPVPRISVQGRNNYYLETTNGRRIPTGRTFARKAIKQYCFDTAKDSKKLETGLDRNIPNPFKENPELITSTWQDEKWIKTKDEITYQTFLEVLDNVPKGTYTSNKNVTKAFDLHPDKPPTFLEKFRATFKDGTNILDLSTSEGRLMYFLVKNNKKFAKTREEINPSLHDFYIGVENEALVQKKKKLDIIREAMSAVNDVISNNDPFVAHQLATIFKLISAPKISKEVTEEKLTDFVYSSTNNQLDNCRKVIDYYKKLKKGDEAASEVYIEYMVQSALNVRSFGISNSDYIWFAQKGVDNLFNLGKRLDKIHEMFLASFIVFDPDLDDDNIYGQLSRELDKKGVVTFEAIMPKTTEKKTKRGRPSKND